MKIQNVRVCQPDAPGAPADWRTSLGQILIAIDTDHGLVGYGVGGGGEASMHVIRSIFRDMLIGHDIEPVEQHFDRLYRASVAYGRKGLVVMALSGIDLALWDLRGKAAGKPIYELLGGAKHRRMPLYSSLGQEPADAIEQGYTAVKLHLPPVTDAIDRDNVVETVRQARQVIGPGIRLMVDAFMNWDVATTLELADRFVEFNVEWLEEPLLPDDFDGYAELVQHSTIPIAGGEHEYTAGGFRELARRRLHAVFQPDIAWCGGMTELVRIYSLAREYGIKVCPHRGAEVWALHAIAALEPNDPLPEAGRAWLTWLINAPRPDRGWISLRDEPGFGVEPDPERVRW